jgi:HlyD family secretion protein
MKKNKFLVVVISLNILVAGCTKSNAPVAYGNFEAKEWVVSSSGKGEILALPIQEGDMLKKGQVVGQIDTIELSLQKNHLDNQITTLRSSLPDVAIQVDVLKQKKKATENECQRVKDLVQAGAADQKKLDQLNDELSLTERQIAATSSSLQRETSGILAQVEALRMQREVIAHRIEKCAIVNPEDGNVQLKFAEAYEFTDIGRPLYKLMDTREMILHCWFPGELLSRLHINTEVKAGIDLPEGKMQFYSGKVTYISQKPEFTPSQVQTKDNRNLLLFHVKIKVANDGRINPGMPAEIFLPAK